LTSFLLALVYKEKLACKRTQNIWMPDQYGDGKFSVLYCFIVPNYVTKGKIFVYTYTLPVQSKR